MTTKDIYQHKEKIRELFENKRTHLYTEYHSFEDSQKAWKYYLSNNKIHILDEDKHRQEAWNNWVYEKTSENFPESIIVVICDRKNKEGSYGHGYLVMSPELASAILTLGELPP